MISESMSYSTFRRQRTSDIRVNTERVVPPELKPTLTSDRYIPGVVYVRPGTTFATFALYSIISQAWQARLEGWRYRRVRIVKGFQGW